MEKQQYRQKISFWLRFSGWLCLLPATMWLYLYRFLGQSNLSTIALIALFLVVAFAVFVLTTANSSMWLKPNNIIVLMVIAILFVAIIVFIPLYFAFNACQKLNNQ